MNGLVRQIAGGWLLAIFGGGLGGGAVCASQQVNRRDPIVVRVLDGRGGLPLARVHLTLIAGYDERDLHLRLWQEEVITDNAGVAQVPDSLVSFPDLRVVVAGHSMCIGDVSASRFSMDRIRFGGLNSPNRCGVPTVKNLSGVFVVFARAKGSDRRPGKGAALLAAESSPDVVGPVARPQSSAPIRGAIPASVTAAALQRDSMLTADGLFLDEESGKFVGARPEAGEWGEWMCQHDGPE